MSTGYAQKSLRTPVQTHQTPCYICNETEERLEIVAECPLFWNFSRAIDSYNISPEYQENAVGSEQHVHLGLSQNQKGAPSVGVQCSCATPRVHKTKFGISAGRSWPFLGFSGGEGAQWVGFLPGLATGSQFWHRQPPRWC